MKISYQHYDYRQKEVLFAKIGLEKGR